MGAQSFTRIVKANTAAEAFNIALDHAAREARS